MSCHYGGQQVRDRPRAWHKAFTKPTRGRNELFELAILLEHGKEKSLSQRYNRAPRGMKPCTSAMNGEVPGMGHDRDK